MAKSWFNPLSWFAQPTRVQIGFEAFMQQAQGAADKGYGNRRTAAAELVSNAFKDVIDKLGGNPESHKAVIAAMQEAVLKDPGVKQKLLGEAQKDGMQHLLASLQQAIGATGDAANAMAALPPTTPPPAA